MRSATRSHRSASPLTRPSSSQSPASCSSSLLPVAEHYHRLLAVGIPRPLCCFVLDVKAGKMDYNGAKFHHRQDPDSEHKYNYKPEELRCIKSPARPVRGFRQVRAPLNDGFCLAHFGRAKFPVESTST
ncbi:hypothetical protein VPH35_020622 [Triticum aestivum]